MGEPTAGPQRAAGDHRVPLEPHPDSDQDTVLATRLASSPDDYLASCPDIGRAVAPGVRELFVVCEPGEALAQQFEVLSRRYIALHDLGAGATRQLLAGIALACGQVLEQLVIRRMGYGTVLATLVYLDCPTPQGPVRLYCTDAEADSATRASLAQVLLRQATLAAVLVGEHPAHALDALLGPLRESVASLRIGGSPRCQDLLLLPLGPVHTLQALAQGLANQSGRSVRLSPQVATPAEAWRPLCAAWNGLAAVLSDPQPAFLPELLASASNNATAKAPSPSPPPSLGAVDRFVRSVAQLPGVTALCLFEVPTSRVLAHLGQTEAGRDLAKRGTLLLAAGSATRRQLQLGGDAQEVVVQGPAQANAVLRLPAQPSWALHMVFTPGVTDWATLKARLVALDTSLPRSPVL